MTSAGLASGTLEFCLKRITGRITSSPLSLGGWQIGKGREGSKGIITETLVALPCRLRKLWRGFWNGSTHNWSPTQRRRLCGPCACWPATTLTLSCLCCSTRPCLGIGTSPMAWEHFFQPSKPFPLSAQAQHKNHCTGMLSLGHQ